MKNRIIFGLILALAVVSSLYVRAIFSARHYLIEARELRRQGVTIEAIEAYRRAGTFVAPGTTSAALAQAELFEYATTQIVDQRTQLLALREARSAILSSRSIIISTEGGEKDSLLQMIEDRITQLAPVEGGDDVVALYPPRARYGMQILSHLTFWSWITLVLVVIWRGFSSNGAMNRSVVIRYGAGAAVMWAVWLVILRYC